MFNLNLGVDAVENWSQAARVDGRGVRDTFLLSRQIRRLLLRLIFLVVESAQS